MEGLSRIVAESLARNGFDRPLDYRRLRWSRWFRCESPHSLLFVPSKPGVFALAEEIMELGNVTQTPSFATSAISDISGSGPLRGGPLGSGLLGGAALQRCDSPEMNAASAAEVHVRRMLAVLQFCEDDDMAFVLDRMFSRNNPMRARLASGRCFVRFVVIEDQAQRRGIAGALNQWLISSSEKSSGIGAHFATSLELTPAADDMPRESVGRTLLSVDAGTTTQVEKTTPQSSLPVSDPSLDSGAARNLYCPTPLPSGF